MIIKFLFSIVFPVWLGYVACKSLFNTSKEIIPLPTRWAMSYGLGLGLLGQWILILGLVGFSYHWFLITLPVAFILLAVNIKQLKEQKKMVPQPASAAETPFSLTDQLVLLYILFQVLFVFWYSFHWPIIAWDAVATSGFKAKILFHEGHLAFMRNTPHATYPLLIPLSEFWVSLNLGEWSYRLTKIIFPLTYISFLSILYYFLKELCRDKSWALWGVALSVSSVFINLHASIADRDFFILFYNCSIIMFLLLWYKKDNKGWLGIAALFAGIITYVKSEGLIYYGIYLFFLFIISLHKARYSLSQTLRPVFRYLLLSLPMVILFIIYRQQMTLGVVGGHEFDITKLHFEISPEKITHIVKIGQRMIDIFFLFNNWNVICYGLVVCFLVSYRVKHTYEIKMLLFFLFIFVSINLFGFSFSPFYYDVIRIGDPLTRCVLHFFPLIPMLVILIANNVLSCQRD